MAPQNELANGNTENPNPFEGVLAEYHSFVQGALRIFSVPCAPASRKRFPGFASSHFGTEVQTEYQGLVNPSDGIQRGYKTLHELLSSAGAVFEEDLGQIKPAFQAAHMMLESCNTNAPRIRAGSLASKLNCRENRVEASIAINQYMRGADILRAGQLRFVNAVKARIELCEACPYER